MLEQRLRSAAGSLERSVAGLDATERLRELAVRRRRQRTAGAVLALVLAAAVLGGVAVAVRHARGPERVAGPATAAPARVVATIPVPGTPVAVAVGHGAVWTVAADANQVVRVDPASGRITARVPVPNGPAALAVTGNAVWVLCPPDNSVARIDPAANRVVATVPVGREAAGLAVAAGSVWVASSLDDSVTRVDQASNRVLATTPVGREPTGVATAGGAVWVALPAREGLGRIDPAGNRFRFVPERGCCAGALAAGEDALWSIWNGALVRLDPATGRALARVTLPRTEAVYPYQVVAAGGAVWVASASMQLGTPQLLWRVDPGSLRVTGQLRLGTTPARLLPIAVAAGDGALWVAHGGAGVVLRLDPTP
jgi:YVTN family beta-propeller protein